MAPSVMAAMQRGMTSKRLLCQLDKLAEGKGRILTHSESAWASITFTGTRHEVEIAFRGEGCAAGERFVEKLPEHEFSIVGQLVADAQVRKVDWRFGEEPILTVTCVLLLLEED
ncbi:MAG: hypothetical protein V2I27_04715 [Erythrobacter sp.]|jgi:hypothetical protein|nr:hypothetical protein [Erythrobacter sp.]